jgi:hypothetical protein
MPSEHRGHRARPDDDQPDAPPAKRTRTADEQLYARARGPIPFDPAGVVSDSAHSMDHIELAEHATAARFHHACARDAVLRVLCDPAAAQQHVPPLLERWLLRLPEQSLVVRPVLQFAIHARPVPVLRMLFITGIAIDATLRAELVGPPGAPPRLDLDAFNRFVDVFLPRLVRDVCEGNATGLLPPYCGGGRAEIPVRLSPVLGFVSLARNLYVGTSRFPAPPE